MQLLTSLLLGATFAAAPTPAKVTSASLFKNGFAVTVREAGLANGETIVENIPQAALGTLWITASDGVKLRQVIATQHETKKDVDAISVDQVLSANVGKTVKLYTSDTAFVLGKILSASGLIVVLQTSEGTTITNKNAVRTITSDGELIWKTPTTTSARVFRIQADAPAGAKVYILALERGLTWAPSYAADISNKDLELTSKATVVNDLADLDGIDVKLITGFPNMPFVNILDPFSLAQNVDQFTGALMNMGAPGQFRRNEGLAMQQNAPARGGSFDQAFDTSGMSGLQAEDLFFYTIPKVQLKKGDRGYFVLFNFRSPFEHVYEWDVADQVQEDQYRPQPRPQTEDVWHSVKFKNDSKQPLTTAAAITTKEGQILGQDMIFFTNPGTDVTLKITKAMDVLTESAEEETGRERKTIQWAGSSNYPFDEITLKGTLSIRNLKKDSIKIKVSKDLTGEIISAEGSPKTTKLAKGLRAVNPKQRLEWMLDLKPGEKRDVTYVYKVMIRT